MLSCHLESCADRFIDFTRQFYRPFLQNEMVFRKEWKESVKEMQTARNYIFTSLKKNGGGLEAV